MSLGSQQAKELQGAETTNIPFLIPIERQYEADTIYPLEAGELKWKRLKFGLKNHRPTLSIIILPLATMVNFCF